MSGILGKDSSISSLNTISLSSLSDDLPREDQGVLSRLLRTDASGEGKGSIHECWRPMRLVVDFIGDVSADDNNGCGVPTLGGVHGV